MVEFPVRLRTQACITAVDEFRVAEFLEDSLFQGLKGLLFVLVSREEGEGKGDPVPICEHPHLHDGVRAVLLAFPIFFASAFLLYLEIIVRAVIIKDTVISVRQEVAVLIGFRLYEIAFLGKDIQGTVDVVLLIGRLLQVFHRGLVGGALAPRLQYPGV